MRTINELMPLGNELTKSQIKLIADQSVRNLLDFGNPIEVAEIISKMELFIKEVKANPQYVDFVRDEVIKFGREGVKTSSGTKIECAEVGTKYNFDNCGDVKWQLLKHQVDSASASLKQREDFLKSIPQGGVDVLDDLSGEVYHIDPPIKTSTSSYKVTISK